jgi:D-amino peptidase
MRILVVSDMEGVAGITKWAQVSAGESLYEEGRHLYTAEINAAVTGAFAGGADEVVVMDCHGAGKDWSFNSLIVEDLHPDCELVVQDSWTEYTGVLEEGCDAALFVGMHARAGSERGGLSHTVSSTDWRNLYFNSTQVGETGINAALCGTWDCPVVLVTGDDVVCAEGKALLGDGLTTVEVKKGISRYAARHLSPARAREMIEAGAREALRDLASVAPYDPGSPCEIVVELALPEHSDGYRSRAGVEIRDPRTVATTADDWWTAWKQIYI